MREWMYTVFPPRADFLETMTDEEAEAVDSHFAYLEGLADEGTVLMAGRRADATMGLVIFVAEDDEEAQGLVDNDPAVRSGVFTAELAEFNIALWSNMEGEEEEDEEGEEPA